MMETKGLIHHRYCYKQKPGTNTSYYLTDPDTSLLPKRLCITRREFTTIACSRKQLAGQVKATFTTQERSIYKRGKGSIHTSIWTPKEPAPTIIGTGDLQGSRDLLIFQSSDEWETIIIHLFRDGLFYERQLIAEVMKKPLP